MRETFFRLLLAVLEKHTPSPFRSMQIQILLNTTAAAFDRPGRMVWHLRPDRALAAYADYTKGCLSDADNEKGGLSHADNEKGRLSHADNEKGCLSHADNEKGRLSHADNEKGCLSHTDNEKRCLSDADYTKGCLSDADYTKGCLSDAASDERRIFGEAYRLGRRIRRITGFSCREDRERLVFYLYGNIGIKVSGCLPGEILIPSCYFANVYTPQECGRMSRMDWGLIAGICGGGKLVFKERLTQGCGRCRAVLTGNNRQEAREAEAESDIISSKWEEKVR